jgi:hypothetical protein
VPVSGDIAGPCPAEPFQLVYTSWEPANRHRNAVYSQQQKTSFAFLSYLIRMPAPTRLSSCHPSRRNQPVLPNFRNPILLRTDFDRYPPRYVGSRNQKEEQGNSATFDLMILGTALRSDLYPSVPMGRILAVKIFRMTLGDQRQTNSNNSKSGGVLTYQKSD